MARRDRDRSGGGEVTERGPRGPQTAGGPRGPQPNQAARPGATQGPQRGPQSGPQGAAPRRGPQEPARPRSVAEDPNAYRSPGFQDVDQNPYKIDYAGLPKDVEEDQEPPADGAEAPAPQGPARAPALPRGMLGRNQDRRGTDPNAYRSPAFQDLDQLHHRFGARRRGPPQGPRTPVLPEGAPAEEPEASDAPPPVVDPNA